MTAGRVGRKIISSFIAKPAPEFQGAFPPLGAEDFQLPSAAVMPKEHKKRGRREEKKRKHLEEQEYSEQQAKRPRQSNPYVGGTIKLDTDQPYEYEYRPYRDEARNEYAEPTDADEPSRFYLDAYGGSTQAQDSIENNALPFYGILDGDELAYFKSADHTLEANSFVDREEKELFISSVWREANGKELKIANTQSCSRFLEKVIRLSSPSQLKSLFGKFDGQYGPLYYNSTYVNVPSAFSLWYSIGLLPTAAKHCSLRPHHA